ncbi:hypothetical protein ACOME3_003840 [Neoechinorhynchus agilis]
MRSERVRREMFSSNYVDDFRDTNLGEHERKRELVDVILKDEFDTSFFNYFLSQQVFHHKIKYDFKEKNWSVKPRFPIMYIETFQIYHERLINYLTNYRIPHYLRSHIYVDCLLLKKLLSHMKNDKGNDAFTRVLNG